MLSEFWLWFVKKVMILATYCNNEVLAYSLYIACNTFHQNVVVFFVCFFQWPSMEKPAYMMVSQILNSLVSTRV